MKRLVHPEITKTFEFKENVVNTVVIENKNFFRKTVCEIHAQCNGESGRFIFSENYLPTDISKNIEIISEFAPFEINQRSLINKINAEAETLALNETNFLETQKLLSDIERFFDNIMFDLQRYSQSHIIVPIPSG